MESFKLTKMQPLRSARNKLTAKQKYIRAAKLQSVVKNKKEKQPEPILNIYAELTRKQYEQVLNDEVAICVPYGTAMRNKAGSRGLFFRCDNESTTQELIEGLEESGIPWQENG